MKIAFIGGVIASLEYLNHIHKLGWKIDVVFSYDESKKRFYSDYASFDEITSKLHLKHIKVNNINDEENIQILKNIQPDIILVMGWSQILKKEIIKKESKNLFFFWL